MPYSTTFKHSQISVSDSASEQVVLIISGWAIPGISIANTITVPAKKIIVSNYNPYELLTDINTALAHFKVSRYSLVAYSLGALFVSHHLHQFTKSPEKVCLISARPHYPGSLIQHIKEGLIQNQALQLKQFYATCFARKKQLHQFLEQHQKELERISQSDKLTLGLQYLAEKPFNTSMSHPHIKLYHGELDHVAPLTDCKKHFSHLGPLSEIPRSGHFIFYDKSLNDEL